MNSILNRIDQLKNKISVYRPFTNKNLLNQIKKFYNIECAWSSNAIEGNSYSLSETKILLEDGLTAGGKPIRDALAIIGHEKAYNYMFSLLSQKFLKEKDLLFLHHLLQVGLENDTKVGEYRNIDVFITVSKYKVAKISEIQTKVNKLLASQESLFNKYHPVVAAAKFHKELAFIHPFVDGNGRISRLAMNYFLIQRHLFPISIPLIRRHEYISTLEEAHLNDHKFTKLMAECELEVQKDFYRMIEDFQIPNTNFDNDPSKQV